MAEAAGFEPLHFGIRSAPVVHGLRLSLGVSSDAISFNRDAHVRLLPPRAECLGKFLRRCRGSNPAASATQSGLRGPAARQRIPARCTHWVGPRHPRDLVGERDGGDLRSPDVLARLGALAPVRAGGGSDERRSSRTSLRVPPSACLAAGPVSHHPKIHFADQLGPVRLGGFSSRANANSL
jgi:hypothetical protein